MSSLKESDGDPIKVDISERVLINLTWHTSDVNDTIWMTHIWCECPFVTIAWKGAYIIAKVAF